VKQFALHIILASERKSRSLNACDGRNKTKQLIAPVSFALFVEPSKDTSC